MPFDNTEIRAGCDMNAPFLCELLDLKLCRAIVIITFQGIEASKLNTELTLQYLIVDLEILIRLWCILCNRVQDLQHGFSFAG